MNRLHRLTVVTITLLFSLFLGSHALAEEAITSDQGEAVPSLNDADKSEKSDKAEKPEPTKTLPKRNSVTKDSVGSEQAGIVKVGVVDTHLLLERYAQIKNVNDILDKELFPLYESLRKKESELLRLREELRFDREENEQRNLERSITNLQRELERMSEDFRQEANLRKNEELYKIQKTINNAILDYANRNNYDLIIEYGLIYSKEELNITGQILEELINKEETNETK